VLGRDHAGGQQRVPADLQEVVAHAHAVARVRGALDGHLTVAALFEHPTIESLAPLLSMPREQADASAAAPVHDDDPHQLLAMLDELSDEELDRLLATANAGPRHP